MFRTSTTVLIVAALVTLLPAADADADSFSLHIGHGHFGFSVSSNDWGVYRDSWNDGHWRLDFHSALDGHGEWVWVNGLGRVWKPWVTTGWQPYTYGRWVHSSYGWTWVSYEPWGYVPHHYGEWARSAYGWVWVPGYVYRPANVVWVAKGSYVGWYPQGPRGWSHSHHAYEHGRSHGYREGYWQGWNDARYATWVEWRHFGAENLSHHALGSQAVHRSGGRSPQRLSTAPSAREVEHHGATVRRVEMEQRRSTVDGRQLTVARPRGLSESVARNATRTVERALSRPAPATNAQRTTLRGDESRRGSSGLAGRIPEKAEPGEVSRRSSSESVRSGYTAPLRSQQRDSRQIRQPHVSDRLAPAARSTRTSQPVTRATTTRSPVRRVQPSSTRNTDSRRSSLDHAHESSPRQLKRSPGAAHDQSVRESDRSQRSVRESRSQSAKGRREAIEKSNQRRSRRR